MNPTRTCHADDSRRAAPILSRRHLLGAAATAGWALTLPGMAMAASVPGARRLVFILMRGAVDGLALAPPVGDPNFAGLRGGRFDDQIGERLDGLFALHRALPGTAAMIRRGEAQVVHAVATRYRDRSHFDGQNILESGGASAFARKDGWLNRLAGQLAGGGGAHDGDLRAMAVSPAVPLALRGPVPASNYAPSRLPGVDEDLLMRIEGLYAADVQLAALWAEAQQTRDVAGDIGGNRGRNGADLGALAARLMNGDTGARIMMLETGGWDTHSAQARRLSVQLAGLDALLSALRDGLGAAWRDTLVIAATEFGRTARINGTEGTDHGTGGAMLLAGGALSATTPVRANWPGLAAADLFDGRDLRPTLSLEQVVGEAVATHFALPAPGLMASLYPDLA